MKKSIVALSTFALLLGSSLPAQAARTGSACSKMNSKGWDGENPIVCKKNSKGKLVWSKFAVKPSVSTPSPRPSASAPTPTPVTSTDSPNVDSVQSNLSVEQNNAIAKAKAYLRSSSFSRSGLIKQLIYEGFSEADSIMATDSQNVDWREQAVTKARQYLGSSAFSYSGLIKQLKYEGFSDEHAIYGVDSQKVDWFDQAVKKGAQYLKSSSFSRVSLIKQLEYEGFSNAEAIYGTDSNGFSATPPAKPSASSPSVGGSGSSTSVSTGNPEVGRIVGGDNWSAYEISNSSTANLTHPSFTITTSTSTGAIIFDMRNDKFPMLKAGEKTWMYMPGSAPGKITFAKYPRSHNRPSNSSEWPVVANAKVVGSKISFTLSNPAKSLRLSGESLFYAFCLNNSGVPVLAEQSKTWTTLLPSGSIEISWPTFMKASDCSSILVNIGPVYE